MTILFGHPGGNPNAHHAALAHFETGVLEAFCVPWMPAASTLACLHAVPALRPMARRLARRRFPALEKAPRIEGKLGEWRRLAHRALGYGDESLSYEANDWLMRTMQRAAVRTRVRAVHSYEDCSLWQFREAKSLGKACIYDMPIGYYPAWQETQERLSREFSDWNAPGSSGISPHVRPDQKRQEMELADLVLVPSGFVESTVSSFHPDKKFARAAYGVDLEFWRVADQPRRAVDRPLRFLYAGALSLRKGIPLLIEAWREAALPDAELELVGSWQLAPGKRAELPGNVRWLPPCSAQELRARYWGADVFVFPSYFEGFGLVLLEAMACGLPVLTTTATAAPDICSPDSGRILPVGDKGALVQYLRWFSENRSALPEMRLAALVQASRCTWDAYRQAVSRAVAPYA
jgi:glycosyltransferase involved in cell wall biosynthesis